MSEPVTGDIPPPDKDLYKALEPGKKDSDGTKATKVELTGTLDSTYTSAAFQQVNANQQQATGIAIG